MTRRVWTIKEMASVIDHSMLKATADRETILRHCKEALHYGFANVCVNPYWVDLCASELRGSGVGVCAVVGFPLGAVTNSIKAEEAKLAIVSGACEIDMVINIGAIKTGDWTAAVGDVAAVVTAVKPAPVKVIIETCYLDWQEKILACRALVAGGARFAQTSTGFGTGGALIEDITLMRQTLGGLAQVKAAGGIRTKAECIAMLESGAERIGTSSGLAIMAEFENK